MEVYGRQCEGGEGRGEGTEVAGTEVVARIISNVSSQMRSREGLHTMYTWRLPWLIQACVEKAGGDEARRRRIDKGMSLMPASRPTPLGE